jgi:hypothetical protein
MDASGMCAFMRDLSVCYCAFADDLAAARRQPAALGPPLLFNRNEFLKRLMNLDDDGVACSSIQQRATAAAASDRTLVIASSSTSSGDGETAAELTADDRCRHPYRPSSSGAGRWRPWRCGGGGRQQRQFWHEVQQQQQQSSRAGRSGVASVSPLGGLAPLPSPLAGGLRLFLRGARGSFILPPLL